MNIELALAVPPGREKMVAEMILDEIQLAEINQERGFLEIELYPRPDGAPWRLPLEDLMLALERCKGRLSELSL